MHLTVTCDLTGARVYAFEVSPDMEMENFLALCQFEIRPLSDKPLGSLGIMHQGQLTEMTGDNLRKTLKVGYFSFCCFLYFESEFCVIRGMCVIK